MYEIFEDTYDYVNFKTFESDLACKDLVLLLRSRDNTVQGFSTIAINPGGIGSKEFSFLFSGDTIISPSYWGSQELVKGFGTALGQIYAGLGRKKLYWFLISKGHRTYLYLPLFFKNFYPSPNFTDPSLERLVDHCSSQLFSNAWSRPQGTIRFSSKLGQLKPCLAEATWKRSANRYVKFFLERNPDFHDGTELACMAEVNPENILNRGRRFVLEGMRSPLAVSAWSRAT